MDLSASGPDGKPVRPIMGSCGHDHRGLPTQGDGVPAAVAPFEAVVVVAQQDDAAVAGEAAAVPLDEIAGHVRKTVAHAIAGQP